MKKLFFILAITCVAILPFDLLAQEEKSSDFGSSLSVDLFSRYNWRGKNLSESPVIQPTMEFSYKSFAIGSWASYTTTLGEFQEVDAYLSFTKGPLTLYVYDYFNVIEGGGPTNNYFEFDPDSTAHSIELIAQTAPFGGFPLAATVGVFVYGNDRDINGDNYYSTYFELAYPFTLQGNSVNIFCGATPAEGYYSDDLDIVNVGVTVSREIEVTDKFKLPLTGTFGVNPAQKYPYFVVGFSF